MNANASPNRTRASTPWWLWALLPILYLSLPITVPVLIVWYTVYWWLYPECHYTAWDEGTAREQEFIDRVRRYASRVSFGTRLVRVLLVPFRGEHYGYGRRRRARAK